MITAELMGRLGNQMFIIAAAHSLALDNDDKAIFSTDLSGITPSDRETMIHRKTILSRLDYVSRIPFVQNIHHEPQDHSYSPITYKDNLLLRGYYQSDKYSEIIGNKKCVSVHVRRGDYLKYSDFHAIMGKDYYNNAMNLFEKDVRYVFFSDDIEWCKQTFANEGNVFIEKQDDVLDLYLMSKIPNNIIGNSSFSWWAAWLNENKDKKIISPSVWFGQKNQHLTMKDLIPENWIKV